MADVLKLAHYPKIPGFIRRTRSDLPPETEALDFLAHAFKLDLAPPRPVRPSLVSSCTGRMDRLFLTIPNYAVAGLDHAYRGIFDSLQPNTRLVIATHESAEPTVRGWLEEFGLAGRTDLFSIGDHLHFSVWAEDGYVAAVDQEDGRTFFIEPFSFPRYGDGLLADFAANATDLENTQCPLYFQGGNVLIGDDFFMIGADYPAKSLDYLRSHLSLPQGQDPAAFIKSLYRDYLDHGRSLLYIASTISVPAEKRQQIIVNGQAWTEVLFGGNHPGTVQPLFHIDMFISLVGREADGRFRVLVGDPRLAASTLGQPVSPNAMTEVFDNIARGLERAGFAVTRNPLPLVYLDDPQAKERFWYFATSNNCLVQNDGSDGKIVWLPTYGHGEWAELAATDEANRAIWTDLGFEVRQLGDFHPFASNLGALHCIKKYLARS